MGVATARLTALQVRTRVAGSSEDSVDRLTEYAYFGRREGPPVEPFLDVWETHLGNLHSSDPTILRTARGWLGIN